MSSYCVNGAVFEEAPPGPVQVERSQPSGAVSTYMSETRATTVHLRFSWGLGEKFGIPFGVI